MSMCICSSCDSPIDSDDDPDCFVEVGNMKRLHKEIILCSSCRERREEEQSQQEYAASIAETEAEKREKP